MDKPSRLERNELVLYKYAHGGDIYTNNDNGQEFIDFSANINPLGLPFGVKSAIIDNIESFTCYPDPLCRELTTALVDYYDDEKKILLNQSDIVCGNGAADLIFRLVLAKKPKQAMVLSPTFAEYELALKLVDCKVIYHSLSECDGFYLDEDIISHINQVQELDMIFICNPNNPTGIPAKSELILQIADKCAQKGILLVVDECFCEFLDNEADYSVIDRINEYKNIVVLKAFTKLYAMAGIRLGYMLCSDNNINDSVLGTLQPWSVSTVAIKCGVAALKEKEYVAETKKLIHENREYLIKQLRSLGFTVFDSKANYVFFKADDTELPQKLKQSNILIRSCKNYVELNDKYYRIAVKSLTDNEKLINCIKNLA